MQARQDKLALLTMVLDKAGSHAPLAWPSGVSHLQHSSGTTDQEHNEQAQACTLAITATHAVRLDWDGVCRCMLYQQLLHIQRDSSSGWTPCLRERSRPSQ